MSRDPRICVVVGVGCLAIVTSLHAQGTDAAVKDRVAQLVDRLASAKAETQDAAEKALIELGAKALPHLPGKLDGPAAERLDRVRKALAEAAEATNIGASKVTLTGKGIRLTEALQQLQAQSGNRITDMRESLGVDVTNPALDLDLKDMPFFEAIDQVAEKAGLVITAFTADGSIGLMPNDAPAMKQDRAYVQFTGPFRVTLKQIESVRVFATGTSTANIQAEVAWEPRLRPMLLQLKTDAMEILDDLGKKIEPEVMQESTDAALQPANPAIEINLNLKAPDRAAMKIAKLKVKGDLSIPAGLKTFKFPSLAKKDVTVKDGELSVTLESAEVDEETWKINVVVKMPGTGPAFESYRQGLFNNRIWLQKADGSRFEHNGGFSNSSSDGGKLGFEYLFVDAPGKISDYGLVYETPSKVIVVPLEFEFKDIPLP